MQTSYFLSSDLASSSQITVITGACRSGKTLLGNLMATCRNVEYADEPWTAMMLPKAVSTEKIDRDFASGLLRAFVNELFNDLVMMRNANFRTEDLSSIWTKKTPKEILSRISKLQTRSDVEDYVESNCLSLVMTLSECGPFLGMIKQALPNCRCVQVVRNGYDVASDLVKKEWYSDSQLRTPKNAQIYRRYVEGNKILHLPFWVRVEDAATFVRYSEYERALYYWCTNLEDTASIQENLDLHSISYHDLVRDPRAIFEKCLTSLGFVPGELSSMSLAQIQPKPAAIPPRDVDTTLSMRTNKLNVLLGLIHDRE